MIVTKNVKPRFLSRVQGIVAKIAADFKKNQFLYGLMLPVLTFYIIFHYLPMYGAVIAFKDYSPMKGIWESSWVGFENFREFISNYYFWRILKNTVIISSYSLLFEFPAAIVFALILNEIRSRHYKSFVQTVAYMPYFVSAIVLCGIVREFTNNGGWINEIYTFFSGTDGQAMLQKPELFRPIYIITEIWQKTGWNSILYTAALTGINQEQYEAARIDGAGRFRLMWYVTLPGISPTIVIMLLLRVGNLMEVGADKIFLLYNPAIYETADTISTFVYRKGLLEANWSYSTAIGLFNSVINIILLVITNRISRRVNKTSLW